MGEQVMTRLCTNEVSVVDLVREGVEAGALGFSSSKTLLHKETQ